MKEFHRSKIFASLEEEADRREEETPPSALRITAKLLTPIHVPDPIMLDSLLAAAVVRNECHGSTIPDVPENASPYVPIPLKVLWRDGKGFPLYATSEFVPSSSDTDVVYYHKRPQTGRFTKRTTSGNPFYISASTGGRWMDRQRPMSCSVAESITCEALGWPAEIKELLKTITHLGKERQRGLGVVKTWRIEPIESFSVVSNDTLTRKIPVEAADAIGVTAAGQLSVMAAWTPPYWQRGLHRLVYPSGTQVKSA